MPPLTRTQGCRAQSGLQRRALSATTQQTRSAGGKALPTTVVQIYQRAHGEKEHGLPVMARTRGVVDDDGGVGGDVMVVERESRSQTALL